MVGGAWAAWRFGYQEWLRRRAEIPTLEGNSSVTEIVPSEDDRAVVSLRWMWRNAGSIPVYIDDERSFVEIYRLSSDIAWTFVDPRQHREALTPFRVGVHFPLKGYGFYMLEPGTNSSILTVPVLPRGETFIARHKLVASRHRHPTGFEWNFAWERWQIFRTDLPTAQGRHS